MLPGSPERVKIKISDVGITKLFTAASFPNFENTLPRQPART